MPLFWNEVFSENIHEGKNEDKLIAYTRKWVPYGTKAGRIIELEG